MNNYARDRAIREARTKITEAYFLLDQYQQDPTVRTIRDALKVPDRIACDYLNNRAIERMADTD
jgi:hypothetical protein